MADKKPSTEDILAQLRKQDASGGGSEAAPPADESSAPAEAESAPAAPAAKPSSTADILAAARAQGGGAASATDGESEAPKPAAKAKPAGGKPSSTADILAAARAQGGGAASSGGGGDAPKPAAKPKPAGGKPSSTADILAAARSQGGGAAGGGAAKAAAAPKPAAAKKAAAPAAGDRPSVSEMVKAAREGKTLEESVSPAKPKLPSKPPLPKKPAPDTDRRGFFAAAVTTICTPYYFAWTVLAAIGGIWSLAVARFMMPNMIVEPPTRFKIGPPSDYPPGTVSTKWKAERGIWVVNTDSYDGRNLVYALASICTHLGCTPNWLEGEQKYKCPCHGSGFYINGINFEGPAPRPLERVGIRLAEDGSLEVDKSVKFQEELGQWLDPASYVELS